MKIGVLTRSEGGWASSNLIRAIRELGHKPYPFKYGDVYISIDDRSHIYVNNDNISSLLDAVIVRPIGRSSLDQAIYRLNILYVLQDNGVKVVNPPQAIERAVDKLRTIHILSKNGFNVPKTLCSENPSILYRKLDCLGKRVVIKPIFGSRGLGSTMLEDRDVIWRVLYTLGYMRSVLYTQKFLEHGHRDIRAFVVGDRVIAAMYRENPESWKTNIARGATPKPLKLHEDLEELAVRASKVIGCEVAGVDILIYNDTPYILEINSQPTWRGLQTITKIDIAAEIIKYIVNSIKK